MSKSLSHLFVFLQMLAILAQRIVAALEKLSPLGVWQLISQLLWNLLREDKNEINFRAESSRC